MADYGEFGRALAVAEGEPDIFTFHGEPFILPAAMSALPLMRFAWRGKVIDQQLEQARSAKARAVTPEQKDQAAAAEGQAEMEALSAVYEFLRASLPDPQDWARFEEVAIRVGAGQDELMGVCNQIYQAVTGRPTRRPADSSAGPSTTGTPSTDAPASQAWEEPAGPPPMSERDRAVAVFLQDTRPVASLR